MNQDEQKRKNEITIQKEDERKVEIEGKEREIQKNP